jgi:hypothetical protein
VGFFHLSFKPSRRNFIGFSMFLNISNHASRDWPDSQRRAAENLGGGIVDLMFPDVSPEAGEAEIEAMAERVVDRVAGMHPAAAMVQGEFTLTWLIVRRLQEMGIACYSATARRDVAVQSQSDGSTKKISTFRFVRFRRYS